MDGAVKQALDKFADKKLAPNQIAVTLVDLRDPQKPVQASYRGGEQIYPGQRHQALLPGGRASLDGGRQAEGHPGAAPRHAGHDCRFAERSDRATSWIASPAPPADRSSAPEQMEEWYDKRNAVNRYFASLGYTNINVNRKPWCEGPYGREMQSVEDAQAQPPQLADHRRHRAAAHRHRHRQGRLRQTLAPR